ncbi:MAG: redoxin domain-containing protein, partial [Lachnospiraceae bacterium]|nr:redoxin domain-containing protein [Lachnospiraceae bacterium]
MNKLKELMKKLGEMKKSHKIALIISAILLVVAVVAAIILLVSCGGSNGKLGDNGQNGSDDSNAEKVTYTVSVKTQGGMVMPELDIYVYADDKLADLKDFKSTDENGIVNFDLPMSDDYAVVVSGAPKGYKVEASYPFTGNTAIITLSSSIITGEDLPTETLGVGDIMYDMTVTTPDGTKYTISELLKEKDMVMLNFWYTTCTYCVEEFPFIEEAYQMYKDKIEILAINPMNDSAAIKSFQEDMKLSFPMAECSTAWPTAFDVQGYPTTVMIDKYGVICVIEAGGMPSLRPFVSAFEHFTSDDYKQKLCTNGISDLVTQIKPTYTMDTSENIGAAINKGDITVTYRPETDDSAEYAWPFIVGEKDGEKVLYASNQKIDASFAIIYADVELKKGQALGFDYLSSTELYNDVLYVIVNGEDIYQISGNDANKKWQSCYPCVATEDGTYELALCYLKSDGTNEGDDTVYIKNMRVVDQSKVDSPTYLPREAATSKDGFEFEYVKIVFNDKDGYYHVGSADGPLLLANLMDYTQFNEEKSVHDLTYGGSIVMEDGTSIYDKIVSYCSYATNSKFGTLCTVNKELAELLKIVAKEAGFDADDENEWLKMCVYYQSYGTNGKQLEDPIKGLSTFSAYKATLGKNIATNSFYYDRAIIPRGLFAAFTPTKSGVYRITSRTE